jgi:hypothetical protein
MYSKNTHGPTANPALDTWNKRQRMIVMCPSGYRGNDKDCDYKLAVARVLKAIRAEDRIPETLREQIYQNYQHGQYLQREYLQV